MQHYSVAEQFVLSPPESDPPSTIAGLVRMITVAEWWDEFDEPIEYLEDPQATFTEDTQSLLGLCEEHGIAYRGTEQGPAFPVWLLRGFYPENP